ncbi:MAG: tRNA (adenosine(37)-N6)-threonylcarbamoyltransferase complex dimerization subunit type 1 TsaB [Flavobacteriaceae bacterium]|nr:tRNA (adenosine(37)-N6)-threonylcarbamoyltransferase complex dimerization subunit type 1 TsaB [Flavobacteriaceae bacterium]
MAYILNIETSTKNCSASIAKDGTLIVLKELNSGSFSHAEKLHVFIEDLLQEAGLKITDLNAVAVGKGPGSYTGLRIGVSAAKGLCYALNVPLISVATLKMLAKRTRVSEGVIVAMLDARRMEVFSAVYNDTYEEIRKTEAQIIDEHSFENLLSQGKVTFIGDGAEKCKTMITHPNAIFVDNAFPSAQEMASLSFEKYQKSDTEDVAYFEPFYLKDFMDTSKKKS